MVKIILDTNILVSATISPKGPPARILDMLADGSFQLVASPPIIAEYVDVLSRKKFGLSQATASTMIAGLRKRAIEIVPSEPLHVCMDPGDDKFLECASAAGASYLVTGNLKHFPKMFGGVEIISPAAFLREADIYS